MSAAKKDVDFRIPKDGLWANMWKIPAGLAAIGAIILAVGFMQDPERTGYSYLFGFAVCLTLALGGMFLVIAHHITQGHWIVSQRRITELVMMGIIPVFVLFLPLVGGVVTHQFPMYDEWLKASSHGGHGDEHGGHDAHHSEATLLGDGVAHAQPAHIGEVEHHPPHGDVPVAEGHAHTDQEVRLHHEVLEHKSGYLNLRGWLIRALIYFAIWIGLALFFFRSSLRQDTTRDPKLTVRMRKAAPVSAILFGTTLTFAAFDWMMSLEPAWYSTIYGVVIFGGAAMSIFALLIVIGVSLYQNGVTGKAINTEHFHDNGKMMFGFMCFWTYVSFSQWMLIWYAGIPEEATWYQRRWGGGWEIVSLFLIFGHFALPFYFLISREVKRRLALLQFGAAWLLVMHVVDIYYYVMPQLGDHPHLSLSFIDVAALLFTAGVFFTFLFLGMKRFPLVPIGDPRLGRSLHHHQSH